MPEYREEFDDTFDGGLPIPGSDYDDFDDNEYNEVDSEDVDSSEYEGDETDEEVYGSEEGDEDEDDDEDVSDYRGQFEDDDEDDIDAYTGEENNEESDEDADETEGESDEDDATDDGEYEPIEVADYVPDDLVPPDFEDDKAELEWYRNKYNDALNLHRTDEFKQTLLETYKDHLANAEDETGELMRIREAFKKNNPIPILKAYFPNYLSENGVDPRLSDEEMIDFVRGKLQDEFGENYEEHFNRDELMNPASVSAKMLARQQELVRSVKDHNSQEFREAKKVMEGDGGPTPERVQQFEKVLSEGYDQYFAKAGFTEDEYAEFIQELSKWESMNIQDLHRALYFEQYIENAKEEGKREALKEIAQNNGTPVRPRTKRRVKFDSADEDYFGDGRRISMGGIPNY